MAGQALLKNIANSLAGKTSVTFELRNSSKIQKFFVWREKYSQVHYNRKWQIDNIDISPNLLEGDRG
jgi:hypothetical protein